MYDGRNVIFVFDSTFDGFLSVIYHAVKNRIRPVNICTEDNLQTMLDTENVFIETDSHNADTVRYTLMDKMGYDGFKRAYYAFLCCEEDSYTAAFKYVLYGLKYGKNTANYLSTPDICRAYELERKVCNEAERMRGFLRFSVMEGGVEYAPIEPENDLLPILMPHFAQRLKNIPFVIHDLLRQKAGVYSKGSWFITDAEGLAPPKLSQDEKMYRSLWKNFYNAICIKERRNLKLQTQNMPKKYRKHITEFQ
ncbi:MAG: TIGR03915 family putative DNA repair protein [Clostridia bacterium]